MTTVNGVYERELKTNFVKHPFLFALNLTTYFYVNNHTDGFLFNPSNVLVKRDRKTDEATQ